MENNEVSKAIDAILANSKDDLDHILDDKERNAYAKIVSEIYKQNVEDRKLAETIRHDVMQEQIDKEKLTVERMKIEQEDRKDAIQAQVEQDKIKMEADKVAEAKRKAEADAVLEQKKIKSERISRVVEAVLKFVGTTLEVGVPAVLMAKQFEQSLDYEKEGVWTSSTVKNLLRFFRPTKR